MTGSDVVNKLLEYSMMNPKKFSEKIGLLRPQAIYDIQNGKTKNISPSMADKIISVFPEIDRGWLLTGEGEMLKDGVIANKAETPNVFTAPLLPLAAQGGTLNDFVMSIKVAECERVVTPIRGVDFVMTVTGDSMAPDYPNGAQVLIKKVDERAFIEWGRVYVLDTCNGSVIKEVRKGDDDDSVQCYSLNPDPKYQPFTVRFADVYGMYRVLMCMSLK